MRTLAVASLAVMLGVLPAAAQKPEAQPSRSGSQQPSSQQQSAAPANKSDQHATAMSQQKLRQSLQQAGFKDIDIVDAAYVVHARTSDGNFVVMYIDPPSKLQSGTTGSASGSAPAQQNK